jgi:hypothetical protein
VIPAAKSERNAARSYSRNASNNLGRKTNT